MCLINYSMFQCFRFFQRANIYCLVSYGLAAAQNKTDFIALIAEQTRPITAIHRQRGLVASCKSYSKSKCCSIHDVLPICGKMGSIDSSKS